MKKDGKYRFSLQFSDASEENIQAGELLERLGNRKSAVVVAALNEYLLHHSELQSEECKIQITVTPAQGIVPDNLEQLIQEMIEKKMNSLQLEKRQGNVDIEDQTEQEKNGMDTLEEDISSMLENLDLFAKI